MADPMPTPPLAEQRPHTLTQSDGTTVDDPWHWLRDREDPATLALLEAENDHAEALLADQQPLRDRLFGELKGRVEESDSSVPVLDGPWLYYRRTLEGQAYAIRCRRPAPAGVHDPRDLPEELKQPVDPFDPPDDEVVLLDENVEAAGHDFYRLGGFAISPDHRLAAEAVDLDGSEVFTIRVRDLQTGELLADEIPRAAYGLAWFNDSRTFLYTVPDDAWRPHRVHRHVVGTDAEQDVLLHEEDDERFWVGLGRTRSRRYLAIAVGSKVSSEWHLLDADDPQASPQLVAPREHGVEYDLDHRGDLLYLVTNADGAEDFKLCVAPVATPGREHWIDLIEHRPGVRLESADVFADHLVLSERTQARTQLRLCDPATGEGALLTFDEEVYAAGIGGNPIFDTRTLRFAYTSLTTPTQVVDLDVETGERTLCKQQAVRGGYDRERFVSWREWATAPDGTRVPISLVRRADVALDGTAPCLLYGYGSYEISIDPGFSTARLSLLERGVVFAIAHVRGGGEMGRRWYEDGKFLAKPNTFSDFVACADHLVEAGIADRARLAIRGGSAGGLLIGASLNLRPDLAAAAVAEVPFVDVVTTMSDPSIPLTVIEYDEWGNPEDPAYLEVMRSYSPYDNVRAADYPALLVTAGLNDPRVQYWEPAKWVAKLRHTATGGGPILLRTELGAGHAGRSGRYDAWRDEARVLAFVLDAIGAADAEVSGPPVPDLDA
ncbi:MAG: S9 family peptidase [Nitriliruptoraceae bacterium]|nr:S9 family peptidase [Nitriliruptoraceae bacterium]